MSQEMFQRYQIRAKKGLGQNFLVDEKILQDIATCVDVKNKNVIEVGPWYGALTEKLLEQELFSLHLVELDRDMIDILDDRIHMGELITDHLNFEIHNQDVLQFTPGFEKYSVIANIPYYITSPILRHFLYDLAKSPEEMLILMQKDVWDKILWKGKNKSSVLSLMIQKKCRVEQRIFVPKESFIPRPKIESWVLYFKTHNDFDDIDDTLFLEVIKKWFLAPRKKLIKNLVMWWFEKTKIEDYFCLQWYSENLRGEDLNIWAWCKLVEFLNNSYIMINTFD